MKYGIFPLTITVCFCYSILSVRPLELQRPSVDTITTHYRPTFVGLALYSLAPPRCPLSRAPWRRVHQRSLYLLLILMSCGDIHWNPGPDSTQDPCLVCGGFVRDDQDGLFCEVCINWGRRTCVDMTESEYYHWSTIEEGWICPCCRREALPFFDVSNLNDSVWSQGNRFDLTNTSIHLS